MNKFHLTAILLIALLAQNTRSQSRIKISYEEEAVFEALRPTINKWLRGEKIKAEFQNKSDFRFQPYLVDVNGDGRKELAVRNDCAPVGNCQFWLFKRRGKSYEIILKSLPASVQAFEFKSTKTNGYFDLETKDHGDAWSGRIEVYRFNGKQYKVSECSTYKSAYLRDGKIFELKKPKIIPVKCFE